MQSFFNNYVQSIETYIMFRIKETVIELTPELEAKGRAPIMLSMGAPTQHPPKLVINTLKKALDEKGMHTYSNPRGEKYYRDAIAQRMKNRFNVTLDPKAEIFSLIGSKEGIANFIRSLINPAINDKDKDIIMLPDPGYASYKEMVKVSGGLSYPIPLLPENNYMPNLETVYNNLINDGFNPQKIKALLINYPNNPLGCLATREYYEQVVKFCKKHNILLVSDAAYADLSFNPDKRPISILEIDGAKDIAVEFFSFSKPYAMTGWRLGWICGNKEVINTFGKLKSTLDSGIFKPLQKAAAEIINSEDGDKYIEQANKEYERKLNLFATGLEELGWKNITKPESTFYLWLPIPPRYKTSEEFSNDLLHKSGVVVSPGSAFGKYGEGYFRVSIVCSEENLKEVIRRMKEDGFYF